MVIRRGRKQRLIGEATGHAGDDDYAGRLVLPSLKPTTGVSEEVALLDQWQLFHGICWSAPA
jgi:hypothetical protein